MSCGSKDSLSAFIGTDKTRVSAISFYYLQILVEDVKGEPISITNIDPDNLLRISVDTSVDLKAESY